MEGRAAVLTGLTTGFADLDKMTSGLQNSDLIILAARPSMGKTSFALMLAENAAIHSGRRRWCVFVGNVEGVAGDAHALFAGQHRRAAVSQRLSFAAGMGADCEVARAFSPTRRSFSTTRRDYRSRNASQSSPPRRGTKEARSDRRRLLAVDVGFVEAVESRQQEVSQISRELKGLAKELNVPLVALSQLSRAPESRSDHRPQLADLRESGALEQDADVVAFIFREEQYKTPEEREAMPEDRKNVAELIIAKQRNGPTGTVDLRFTPSSMRFDNLYRE